MAKKINHRGHRELLFFSVSSVLSVVFRTQFQKIMKSLVWVTPGLGFEPKCSRGTTGLEPAALVRSATPAVCNVLAQGVVLR